MSDHDDIVTRLREAYSPEFGAALVQCVVIKAAADEIERLRIEIKQRDIEIKRQRLEIERLLEHLREYGVHAMGCAPALQRPLPVRVRVGERAAGTGRGERRRQ